MASGMGVAWILLADTIAGSLIILALSGILLWTRLHGPRLLAAGTYLRIPNPRHHCSFGKLSNEFKRKKLCLQTEQSISPKANLTFKWILRIILNLDAGIDLHSQY